MGSELARLAALHRDDDQPSHKVWAHKLTSTLSNGFCAVAAIPQRQLELALSLPSRASKPSFARPPAARKRTVGSERNFFNLVRQLSADAAEPGRATHLYVSLRPLHERLARHQAVLMGARAEEAAEGDTPAGKPAVTSEAQ